MKDLSCNEIEVVLTVLRARQYAAIDRRNRIVRDLERIGIELDVLATIVAELVEQQRREEETNPCS